MSGITADLDGLSGNAPLYGAAADDVAAIHATLASRLDAEGACWGNDEAGRSLAAKYVGPALAALRTMVDTERGLQSMVGGVYQWAQSYVSADDNLRQDLLTVFRSQ